MNGLRVRIRMGKLLKKMNRIFDEKDIISGEDLSKFLSSPLNRRAVSALEQSGCIKSYSADDQIDVIVPGDQSAIYVVERAELWLNRIISFTAGIASTLIVQWLLTHLS